MTDLMSRWSLEITARDLSGFAMTASAIPPGTLVSVTCLPAEDEAVRVRAAVAVRQAGLIPVPHLSARGVYSKGMLERHLAQLTAQAAVDHVFVIAGDQRQVVGPFQDALALIRSGVLEQYGISHVGISGYPEGHRAISGDRLWRALDEKAAALRERGLEGFIVTQFGFAATPILDWLKELRQRGLTLPVRVGIAGPASLNTLIKFAARCGVKASARGLGRYGGALSRLLREATPSALVHDLAAGVDCRVHGEIGLHLYPFGGLDKTVRWLGRAQAGRG